ncbi:MAG: hypothetical protein L0219_10980, partial [Phycisphaerales bacterium]|nr:hypothetical protein [Phycisphaerales bacterium]
METNLELKPIESIECDVAVLVAYENGDAPGIARELYESKEFSGKSGELVLLHRPAGFAARRLLLIGGGKRERFSTADLRKAAATAVRHVRAKSMRNVVMSSPGDDESVAAAVEGALLGNFEPDALKSEKNGDKNVERFTVAAPSGESGLRRGRILGESQNLARELVNEPSNRLTPLVLAARARAMAAEQGLECDVLDQDRMQQMGMGALLGVAMGSAEPPALIVLRYRPGQVEGTAHLGLVGKGVTFDSGGLSIKPADGMEKMKYDMAGGAAALGAMRAIAQLKPAIPVTALIPAVENMTGSKAQRPGDIVKSLSGKTIEVLNTDAEGRLILADALTYA